MRSLWRNEPHMPTPTTIGRWRKAHPAFRVALLDAQRRARLDRIAVDEHQRFEARLARAQQPAAGRRPRPSTYSAEIGEAVCARLEAGESLSAIGRDPAMPHPSTIYKWVRAVPEFKAMYAWARRVQGEAFVDEALEVARAASPGVVALARLRIETLRWQAARVAPMKYVDPEEIEAIARARRQGSEEEKDQIIFMRRDFDKDDAWHKEQAQKFREKHGL